MNAMSTKPRPWPLPLTQHPFCCNNRYAMPGHSPVLCEVVTLSKELAEQSSFLAWWAVDSILQGGMDLQDEWKLLFLFSFFSS